MIGFFVGAGRRTLDWGYRLPALVQRTLLDIFKFTAETQSFYLFENQVFRNPPRLCVSAVGKMSSSVGSAAAGDWDALLPCADLVGSARTTMKIGQKMRYLGCHTKSFSRFSHGRPACTSDLLHFGRKRPVETLTPSSDPSSPRPPCIFS